MLYTVKEVCDLSGVTIKTLYHYHKIGLLVPKGTTEAGYRLYGMEELERLQRILYYRELDFSLDTVKQLLEGDGGHESLLAEQKELLTARKQRLEKLIHSLEQTITKRKKGEPMHPSELFQGFHSEDEWKDALKEQNDYLKETYDYDLLEAGPVEAAEMNESAREAIRFMTGMADALRSGLTIDSAEVRALIGGHLAFLRTHGHEIDGAGYAAQARFFLADDFHRGMLESQQVGLAYYLCLAAESFAQAA